MYDLRYDHQTTGHPLVPCYSLFAARHQLRRQYGQYAAMFLPRESCGPMFQCCQGLGDSDARCLMCEISDFNWREAAFPPMPEDLEELLHEAAERSCTNERTVQEVMAGYKA